MATAYCKYCGTRVECNSVVEFHNHLLGCFQPLTNHASYDKIRSNYKEVAQAHFVSKEYGKACKPKDLNCFKIERQPKIDRILLEALNSNGVRETVKMKLRDFWFKDPGKDFSKFGEKVKISGTVTVTDEKVYYRKMSNGEYTAANDKKGNRFQATFLYTDTKDYRYWMSSSLAKVQAFGNENAKDCGSVIVKMTFKKSLLAEWPKPEPHYKKNVQNNPEVVSIHREGFAEIGLMVDSAHVLEVIGHTPRMDHNLGFTSMQSARLWELFESASVVN